MISSILLAAGQSKRFKNENKLTKVYKNKPLINHILSLLIRSEINKIILVVGYEASKIKKISRKSKKIIFVLNKNFKNGISSSIKTGLKKISKTNKGFIIVHSDMPFVTQSNLNKIHKSISKKKYLVHALRFENRIGNPIGFDISLLNKFKKINGDVGAKFIVKKLKKNTNFIKVRSNKIFKDLDLKKDFN